MNCSISQALKSIAGKRILLVGDVMLDSYIHGETVRVSREAPVIVVRKESIEHRLGGAANTAANLAALQVKTEIAGWVGHDDGGGQIRKMLLERGIDTSALASADIGTQVKTRVMAGAFGTTKQQVLRLDEDPKHLPPQEFVDDLLALIQERSASVDAVVLSDYGGGVVGEQVIHLAQELVRSGKVVCVDSRHRLHLFSGMTIVTPNIPEAEEQLNRVIASQEDALSAGEELLATLDLQACLLTQGRAGMTLFERDQEPLHVDIIGEDEVTDVTGAGDTVIATFSAALAAGLGMQNATKLANCAAGVVVCKAGAAVAQPQEVIDAATQVGLELLPWEA